MKRIYLSIASLIAACVLLNGCGDQTNKSVFDSAKPELKSVWLQALAEVRDNDYVSANTNLVSLLRLDITSPQQSAVLDALNTLNERMHNAAARGDVNAQKALETLKAIQQPHARPSVGSQRYAPK